MKKILWIIIGLALVGLVIFKLASNKKTTESVIYQYDKEKPIAVDVDTIRLQNIDDLTSFTGTFEPYREVKLSAETQGRVNAVYVDVGSNVRQGQTIIQLDNSLLKLQLQAVEVQIEGLQDDVNRYTVLTEADAIQGVQLEKTKLGLKSAYVQKTTLEEQISKTTIKAPFNGIVTAKLTEVGAFAGPGVPLLQITDLSTLKFTTNVPEMDLKQFQSGQEFLITADALSDISLDGKLLMIGSKANMGNSFPVQFQVNNTAQLDVRAGMFGSVELTPTIIEQAVLIPSSAIMVSDNKEQVYILKNGKAILQNISTSGNVKDKAIVSSGLEVGDIIVIAGFINLFEEANVSIKN